ncbi:MAG: endo alpha-1,4 polygalactosaminidase [Gammaproteobacteria bacterium]|nr:endo alpha-1,4 polygalactosaminidase [Gammaproteobacteria bacterium]
MKSPSTFHSIAFKLFCVISVSLMVVACGDDEPDIVNALPDASEILPITSGGWYKPGVSATWQWQIQGETINTSYDVEIYDIDPLSPDLSDAQSLINQLHNDGRKVICYFSAGSYESWRNDAADFQEADLGNTMDGYANERWLDVRSENVHNIMKARLSAFKTLGCDGVEPDNVNIFENDSGKPITAEVQLAYNRWLANEAHKQGLSVGLKNDNDQAADLVDYFDFHVSEECHEFDECEALAVFVNDNKPVLNAEYLADYKTPSGQTTLCAKATQENIRTVVFSKELDDSYRYSCD